MEMKSRKKRPAPMTEQASESKAVCCDAESQEQPSVLNVTISLDKMLRNARAHKDASTDGLRHCNCRHRTESVNNHSYKFLSDFHEPELMDSEWIEQQEKENYLAEVDLSEVAELLMRNTMIRDDGKRVILVPLFWLWNSF